jgi:glucose-6-phosphate 1-dehydrogenase
MDQPGDAHQPRPADPCVIVVFGASGDLTKRKLVPSLLNLAAYGLLSRDFAVIGFALDDLDDEGFRDRMTDACRQFATAPAAAEQWEALRPHFHYVRGEFNDGGAFERLKAKLAEVDAQAGTQGNRIYYLATPPSFFAEVAHQLERAGMIAGAAPGADGSGGWTRLIIEKPFGRDLESARELNRALLAAFREDQIYRIDHYLGKETVQNILLFRFANGIFEPIWNRRYVDHVQILVSESVGVELRGRYYEEAGALRDMVQNHMLQLLSLVAMEPPISFGADAVRDEKVKVLHAIRPMDPESCLHCAIRGQYGPGVIAGERVPGYREEPNVSPTSTTETFAAMKLFVENWRWADVPFYLRTGKRLARRDTEVVIQFRRAPLLLVQQAAGDQLQPNRLTLHIQPDERISMQFQAKLPGPTTRLTPVEMQFRYSDLPGSSPATGYETLLYDCMIGDQTLFQRADMVEAAWRLAAPVLDVWKALPPRDFPNYAAGSMGPQSARALIERDGRHWIDPA